MARLYTQTEKKQAARKGISLTWKIAIIVFLAAWWLGSYRLLLTTQAPAVAFIVPLMFFGGLYTMIFLRPTGTTADIVQVLTVVGFAALVSFGVISLPELKIGWPGTTIDLSGVVDVIKGWFTKPVP